MIVDRKAARGGNKQGGADAGIEGGFPLRSEFLGTESPGRGLGEAQGKLAWGWNGMV